MNKINEVIWNSGLRKGFIAKKMGISQSNISMWIDERRKPNKQRIKELCKILDCTKEDLFPGERKGK